MEIVSGTKKVCGVYAIRNTVNGKMYIGSSVDVALRWSRHRQHLRQGKHHSWVLQRAWNKYGEASFVFELIQTGTTDSLRRWEQVFLDCLEPAYNIVFHAGGGGYKGRIVSAETGARIRASKLGHQVSPETRAKLRAALKGRPLSQGTRQKMSLARRGRRMTEENRAKLIAANRGRAVSIETRTAISNALRGNNNANGMVAARAAQRALRRKPSPAQLDLL